MSCFKRVGELSKIPVLDRHGAQISEANVAGRMVLPLSISLPIKGDEVLGSERYYLSILSGASFGEGELVYLHEQIPVTR